MRYGELGNGTALTFKVSDAMRARILRATRGKSRSEFLRDAVERALRRVERR